MSIVSDLASVTPQGFVANIAGKLIDTVASFFPNPEKKAEAAQAIAMAQLQGAFKEEEDHVQLMLAQTKVNETEATSTNWLVAGWRPYVGWISGTSLGLIYIPKALVLSGVWTYQAIVIISHWNGIGAAPMMPPYPDLGVTDIIGLLCSLLGFGTMRSYEKKNNVEGNR